ncbi:hypothetical protein [Halopseudomonas oceani]|uniref:hypothetical protein n=1 Tax=Halopseudomonas oceani TaxID=1708783 RepID=UPI002AA76951|nr:hypothetical protein [Halopseudomonas oceani]
MHTFRTWPLAVAISSALTLTACGGGGGGGNGGGNTAATTTFNLSVGTPTTVTATPVTAQERLAAALIDFLITPALAQTFDELDPGTFRVLTINADGTTSELINGEDFSAQGSGGTYTLELPFSSRFNSYVEVPLPGNIVYQVPTTRTDLLANPLTTFVTQQIASRVAQFDQLTLEEVDDIIATVIEMAADPQVQAQLEQAINTSSSTEQLLAAVGEQLSASIEQALDDKAAPPLTSAQTNAASGDYYSSSITIGGFSDQASGLLVGGFSTDDIALSVSSGTGSYGVAANGDFDFEIISSLGPYAGTSARAELDDEASGGSFPVDSRGFTFPESEDFGPYEKGSDNVLTCETVNAACTDREYQAGSRTTAAGSANAPFNTLVSTGFFTRDVRDAGNVQLLQVFNGDIGLLIKKSTSTPPLDGHYGSVELLTAGGGHALDLEVYTTELQFNNATGVAYCEKALRWMELELDTLSSESDIEHTADCLDSGSNPVELGSDGALDVDLGLTGWLSPDGLTLVTSLEEPMDRQTLLGQQETHLQTDNGLRQYVMAVKTAQNADLSNRQYRMVAVGLLSEYGAVVEPHRLNAGYLSFDGQGQASLSTAWMWQSIDGNGFGNASLNDQVRFEFSAEDIELDANSGGLSLNTSVNTGSDTTLFSADGWVQEGGQLIILGYDVQLTGSVDASMLGVMIGVCTNCDQ